MMKHLLFLISFVILSSVSSVSSSFANDVEVFLKQVEEIAKKNNGSFTYTLESSNEDGDAVVKDLKLSEHDDKNTVTIDELLISKGKKIGEHGFGFEGLVANSILVNIKENQDEPVSVNVESLKFANVEYPDLAERKHPFWPVNIEAAALNNFSADIKDEDNTFKFTIPSISLAELKYNGGEAFSLSSFILSPFDGDISGKGKAQGTFSFEGITISDSEYLGEFAGRIGALELGALIVAGVTEDNQSAQIDFAGASAQNLYFPGGDDSRSFVSQDPVNVNVGALKMSFDGHIVLGWDSALGSSTFTPLTNIMDITGGWQNFFIDFAKLPMEESAKRNLRPMFDLGYEKLSMNMDYLGTWNIESGLVDVSKLGFDVVDAFAFDLNMNFSGYTEALARQINKLSNQTQLSEDPKQQQAIGLQILALMSSLSINEMSIELEDRSLLNKVIDYQAAKQNQDPEQIRGIVGPMVGIMLAPFQIPEFANNLSAALTTFMQGNKSIMLALKPLPPVNGAEMAALFAGINAGSTTPAELLQRFNVTVGAQ